MAKLEFEKFREKGGPTQNPGKGGTRGKGGSTRYKGGTDDPQWNHGNILFLTSYFFIRIYKIGSIMGNITFIEDNRHELEFWSKLSENQINYKAFPPFVMRLRETPIPQNLKKQNMQ